MTTSAAGACLCGAVRFAIDLPTRWVAHCHCSMCRRAHGAAFVTWASVAAPQFRVTEGEAEVARYASSPDATRSFCRRCGASLWFTSTRWAGEVHVARALIDGPLDRDPQVHAFYDDKAPWIAVADGLPRRGGRSGVEPLP
jgi:hypothetical protein